MASLDKAALHLAGLVSSLSDDIQKEIGRLKDRAETAVAYANILQVSVGRLCDLMEGHLEHLPEYEKVLVREFRKLALTYPESQELLPKRREQDKQLLLGKLGQLTWVSKKHDGSYVKKDLVRDMIEEVFSSKKD